ncbi:DNA polymerase III subunit alpha [Alkalibacter mobilis]|uniref:DNA polymerase III subunit alpha n=1 Tax=Alkalibacter mobilis TaxID=2787712 RepID=UPI00189F8B85|nr:DNA polymerase III subunit alpha [Alkalibacter mobilis]MBF7095919.1 DNA polymerase III subunit alpha [Alkalibacter mobilis]
MGNFAHLHLHTEYSLLDGFCRIKDLVSSAKEAGMKSLAITDHGVMFGVVDFYKECKKQGIKPIIGCEVYIAPRSMESKESKIDSNPYHLVLLAKNRLGYENLMKIVSAGFVDGFYYKPRVDRDYLRRHSEGLICLSACLGGEIPKAITGQNMEKALETAKEYREIFGEDFYLELQNHNIPEQKIVNRQLEIIAERLNIQLVATNDVHYVHKENARSHDILLCIQTATNVDDPDRMKFPNSEFYLKNREEMERLFPNNHQALDNTQIIADKCDLDFDFSKIHLPRFPLPEGVDPGKFLADLCHRGIREKYGIQDQNLLKRLEYELSVIDKMGYNDYFLIVWDFIKYAKDNGIMVGPGRGSAAGSLVSYALDITTIDPIRYNLIFERFLNPDRISMPDIDIDFCYENRQRVIDYVVEKYGNDHVAQIITFGTMAARAAIRDVGRSMNIPYSKVDKVAKQIPMELGMTIEKALQTNHKLMEMCEEDEETNELIKMSRSVEGLSRHASTHAAGVVISNKPVVEHVPLYRNNDSITTQFTMTLLEELGLLKMDFLGLRTLTVIRDAVDNIKKSRGIEIDIDNLDYDDREVYDLISSGDTLGVFQLESPGMQKFMSNLKPDSFEDIIAGISLYRPGPMEQIPTYIRNKKSPESITYVHEILRNILDVTYGCMVYQEQVMQIVRDVAGYSMGRSDLVRRAMSKKKMDVMEAERRVFIYGEIDSSGKQIVDGAVNRGVAPEQANKIYDQMIDFAKYAFNKSHAAAYAVIAYQTAWLKKHYPVEFMAALLTSVKGNETKVAQYIANGKKNGIEVLPPDVNESFENFTVIGDKIRFGLAAVKNVGENAVKSIMEKRKEGSYLSFGDFCRRSDLKIINKRAFESLIKCGAFDSFGIFRSQLMNSFEKMIESIQTDRKYKIDGQISLFQINETLVDNNEKYPDIPEFEESYKLTMEKEMLGLYITGHPLEPYRDVLEKKCSLNGGLADNLDELLEAGIRDGQLVTIGGIITAKKNLVTKNSKTMCFLTIEDLYGVIDTVVFPTLYKKYEHLLEVDNKVIIKGKINISEDQPSSVLCEEMALLEGLRKKDTFQGLQISVSNLQDGRIDKIKEVLTKYNGDKPVVLHCREDNKRYKANKALWVCENGNIIRELDNIVGKDNVEIIK